jgi:hypothetical protein
MMMVDPRLLRSLRWLLLAGGVLGLLSAASMLLVTLAVTGHSLTASSIVDSLPSWLLWTGAPPSGISMLIAGFVCVLLLVTGRWPVKVCAAVVAAWFVYAQAGFNSASHWAQQADQSFDFTPFYVGGLIGAAAMLVVSVLALVIATRPLERARSLPADLPQPPVADAAQPPLP